MQAPKRFNCAVEIREACAEKICHGVLCELRAVDAGVASAATPPEAWWQHQHLVSRSDQDRRGLYRV
jgi:hypothetical protein